MNTRAHLQSLMLDAFITRSDPDDNGDRELEETIIPYVSSLTDEQVDDHIRKAEDDDYTLTYDADYQVYVLRMVDGDGIYEVEWAD